MKRAQTSALMWFAVISLHACISIVADPAKTNDTTSLCDGYSVQDCLIITTSHFGRMLEQMENTKTGGTKNADKPTCMIKEGRFFNCFAQGGKQQQNVEVCNDPYKKGC
ncbi:hypothetical protein VNO78_16189 [Psophocarpus tetragonolobus]|uniref:Uncharacterized protein n=1 Tax=Psophocarpus tetragonolobus TaxID=3891 RepID=A0AAN9XK93_PSOTE